MIQPEGIEWDEVNILHATRHGVSVEEIGQVLNNDPFYRRNKRTGTGDYLARHY